MRDAVITNSRELESRLSALEHSVANIDSLVQEQLLLSQSLRALIGTYAREQAERISTITARQDDINYQLRKLLEKLQVIQLYGGLETKSPEKETSETPSLSDRDLPGYTSPETPVNVNPENLYESALSDIEQKNYVLAESRFMSFLLQFPEHSHAPNAQYWLGEAAYAQSKYDLAIKEFEKVAGRYPKSSKVRAAMLKIGFAQIEKGSLKTGTETLKTLIKKYKKSDEAKLAREKLNELK